LLKLRKVEIVGFKSFCERTVVTFSGIGTTCIVGPNGCGKSNVVDAISWVLGEQSHKSLRAERMADCIFNGTAKRPPMGLAEVTITLEDPELAEAARFVLEGAVPPEFSESPAEAVPETAPARSPESAEAASPEMAVSEVSGETVVPLDPEGPAAADPAFLVKKKKKAEKPAITSKPGEVVVSDMPRLDYFAGQKPPPPRPILPEDLLARAADPACRYVVLVERQPESGDAPARRRTAVDLARLRQLGLEPLSAGSLPSAPSPTSDVLIFERPRTR